MRRPEIKLPWWRKLLVRLPLVGFLFRVRVAPWVRWTTESQRDKAERLYKEHFKGRRP